MTGTLVAIVREGMLLVLLLAAPILVATLVAGVLSGLLAAFTQIQDPRGRARCRALRRSGVAIVLFAPTIAHQLEAFATRLWPLIAAAGSS